MTQFFEHYPFSDLEDVSDFFGKASVMHNPRLRAENINCLSAPDTRLIQLDRYQDSFELGCMDCNVFIDIGSTAAWEVNGLENYDLLYSFLSEHKNCAAPMYVATMFSSDQPWQNDYNVQSDQPHCNPDWVWDIRSLNPKTVCCYKNTAPNIPDLLPDILVLKANDSETFKLLNHPADHLNKLSDWLYDHRDSYIKIL